MSVIIDIETIAALRRALGLTLEGLAHQVGLAGKGNLSAMERDNRAPLHTALKLEKLALEHGYRLDAAKLNEGVSAARYGHDWELTPAEMDTLPDGRVIICDLCEREVREGPSLSCTVLDCPHARRGAA